MKYKFRRYLLLIGSLICIVVIITIMQMLGSISANVYLGLCATLITIFISIINYYQTSDRFFKELFTDFNLRYDKMNNFLNQLGEDDELNSNDQQRIMDYLNLCAEEYMWMKKGRLPEDIWRSWKNGIDLHLRKKYVRKVFAEERLLWKSSYYGFFDEIEL
jgi:hypothetical protein